MPGYSVIGKSIPRVDALAKVTGKAKYTTDIRRSRMLYGKVLRSPHPHARIKSIDVSRAGALPGVRAIVTGRDAPTAGSGLLEDRQVLAREVVRFAGEPVAAVAADTVEAAQEAVELIEVDYEELPAVFDPEEAMKPDPPAVVHPGLTIEPNLTRSYGPQFARACSAFHREHPNVFAHARIRTGDVARGFAESDLIVEGTYKRTRVSHAQMEPHAAVVEPGDDGGLTAWVTSQSPYQVKETLAKLFGLPATRVRVIIPSQGGGFGGRVGANVSAIPIAALLAMKSGRAVKVAYSRDEVFIDGCTEIPATIYIKDGVKKDGTLVAREMRVIQNSGAYSGAMPTSVHNVGYASTGTYRAPNFKADTFITYTNETPTAPFRGYAAIGPQWAIESHMDVVAARLGMDPVEFRLKNVLKEGEKDALGQTVRNIGLEDCIHKVAAWLRPEPAVGVRDDPDYRSRAAAADKTGPWKRGRGLAACNKMTTGNNFASVVFVKVHPDGGIEVRQSAVDIGQGCYTAFTQMAAEEFATTPEMVKIVTADTAITPFDYGTISNRVTWHTGNALRLACEDAKRQLLERAGAILGVPPANLYIESGTIYRKARRDISLKFAALFSLPGPYLPNGGEILGRGVYVTPVSVADFETGHGERLVSFYSYGADAVELEVNVRTGEVRLLRAAGCFDMATPINPKICQGQTEGGIGQGIGGALYEQVMIDRGVVTNPNFVDYRLPSIMEVPPRVKAMNADPAPHPEGPFGAKGFCEGGLLPIAPAIANAVWDAVGVRITDLPITREKILKALKPEPVGASHGGEGAVAAGAARPPG